MRPKKGKAPGQHNIAIDLTRWRDNSQEIRQSLYNLLKQNKIPDNCNNAMIVLHEKGNPKDLATYRPISLQNGVYKLFTKLITNTIHKILDENQPKEQAGFRKGYSTTDHLQTVRQIIGKTRGIKHVSYICLC